MADTSTALLIDFGSTYTKLRAVDLDQGKVLASGQGPSTVTTDINEGMTAALGDLESHMGRLPTFKHRFASSSAAGGLKMVTIGLVKELTAEAARLAALGVLPGVPLRLVQDYPAYVVRMGFAELALDRSLASLVRVITGK